MFKGPYEDFFEALRQRESSGDYTVVNSGGFLGAYQFGEAALVDLGFVTNDGSPFDNDYNGAFTGKHGVFSVGDFLNSMFAQDEAATEWFSLLWGRIRFNDLEFYDQQTLNGVLLTKSGMIAGAHLLGTGGLRDFILSGGTDTGADGNGTTIIEYINLLGNYETPSSFLNNLDQDNDISGGAGEDVLNGMAGNDTLTGNAGADLLYGGEGDDLLIGDGAEAIVMTAAVLGPAPFFAETDEEENSSDLGGAMAEESVTAFWEILELSLQMEASLPLCVLCPEADDVQTV